MKLIRPFIFLPPPIDENDRWLPITKIPTLRDYYYVNTYSQVYSGRTDRILAPSLNHAGYVVVSMNCENCVRIQRKVHRLSMMEFCYILGCEQLEVNHKDGNKLKNHLSNLEWMTTKENVQHAIANNLRKSWKGENNPKCAISELDARNIGELFLSGVSIKDLQKLFCINRDIIMGIISGNTWRHLFSVNELLSMQKIYCICSSTIES